MNTKKNVLKATASMLLPLMAVSLPIATRGARALTSTLNNANAVNTSALKQAPVNCDNFCSMLVNSDISAAGNNPDWTDSNTVNKVSKSPTGGTTWTATASPSTGGSSDQWCADHGYITNAAVQPNSVTPSTKSCKVTMLSTDTSCDAVNQGIMMCQFHNSQLIPQCLAYEAIAAPSTGTKDAETAVLSLDIAAAATCATACIGDAASMGTAGSVLEGACQLTGASASAAEIVSVFAMSSGKISSIMNGVLAGAGGTATGVNIAAAQDANGDQSFGTGSNGDYSDDSQNGTQRKASCVAAAVYAAMAGVRGVSYSNMDSAKGDACTNVQSLASSALSGSTDSTGGTSSPASTGFSGVVTAGGTVSTPGSGGSNGSSLASNQPGTTSTTGNPTVPSSLSAATDGGLLTQSGLDKLVGKPAADIAKALSNGATPAQALQSALGSGSGSGIGGALGSLAQATRENASSLGSKLNMGSVPSAMYAGGGGGSRSGGGDAANPFAGLFGAQGAAGGANRAVASEQFGARARPMDIYHTGTTQNLFEIISTKVSQVAGRVGTR